MKEMRSFSERFSATRHVFYVLGSSHENLHSPLFERKMTYAVRDIYNTYMPTKIRINRNLKINNLHTQRFLSSVRTE